jgi:putative copper export protein/methionine-rich copper-binding protein CopC
MIRLMTVSARARLARAAPPRSGRRPRPQSRGAATGRCTRRARALAALLWLAAALLSPRAAQAHGTLRSSTPAKDARLTTAPRVLRLVFSERVELALARVELIAPGGSVVALSPLRSPGDSAAILVTDVVGAIGEGRHTVRWRVAGRDGHPVSGTFSFTVLPGAEGIAGATPDTGPASRAGGDSADAPPIGGGAGEDVGDAGGRPATPVEGPRSSGSESPLYAAVRWLAYAALLALIGTVAFTSIVVPRAARGASIVPADELRGRAAGIARLAARLFLAATLARLVMQLAALGAGFDAATLGAVVGRTAWGIGWWLSLAASVMAVLAVGRGPGARWGLVAAGVAVASLGSALSGHATAVLEAPVAVMADALHLLGAGAWLGSLLCVAAVAIPVAMGRERGVAMLARLVNAFSPLALAGAALAALTGLAAVGIHLGSSAAAWSSGYGRLLLVKLALLAGVAALGAFNWRVVRPRLGDDASAALLRRAAYTELALGAAVVAVTAFLVATPPPVAA